MMTPAVRERKSKDMCVGEGAGVEEDATGVDLERRSAVHASEMNNSTYLCCRERRKEGYCQQRGQGNWAEDRHRCECRCGWKAKFIAAHAQYLVHLFSPRHVMPGLY